MEEDEVRTGVYKRSDGLWAWRIVADNGNIVGGDMGQGYENRDDANRMMIRVASGEYWPNVSKAIANVPVEDDRR